MTETVTFGRVLLSKDAEVDQLLHPSRFYARPADVVADDLLTVEERRAILSSWASDACAVDSNPLLRQPPFAQAPVTFDEIMDALQQLDRIECSRRPQLAGLPSGGRHTGTGAVSD
jgi:hypothetical protein